MARPRKETDLVRIFQGPKILTLEQLCNSLRFSRSTVLRRLNEHSYYSSYNHSGRFLTIQEVADFDAQGLWFWRTARFSKSGTLKQTVQHFVQTSDHGMTHNELAAVLFVQAQNTLLNLVEEKSIHRERLGGAFVYFSCKASVRRQQISRRRLLLAESQKPVPTSRQIIATLLELIKDPGVKRQEIVVRGQRSGVSISQALVEAIFEKYDLDKKRAL
jgi:hypothetical protein